MYDNVPWGTFPYNEHSTSSLEGLLRNGDEDTDKDNERKEDFKNENQRIKDEDREEKMRIVETAVMREKM